MSLSSEERLKAWGNWKAICSISGCRPDAPAILERLARKEGTRELYGKYYEYMRNQIFCWFEDSIGKKCGIFKYNSYQLWKLIRLDFEGLSLNQSEQEEQEEFEEFEAQETQKKKSLAESGSLAVDGADVAAGKDDRAEEDADNAKTAKGTPEKKSNYCYSDMLISKLDSLILEYHTKPGLKVYKDKIWFDAGTRTTPVIQTISCSLKYLMLTIAEKMLRQYANVSRSSDVPGAWEVRHHKSMDEIITSGDDSEGTPFGNLLPDPSDGNSPEKADWDLPEQAQNVLKLCGELSTPRNTAGGTRGKILLLALLSGLNLTDPLVLRCMQGGRDICTRTKKCLSKKMETHLNEFSDLICTDHGKKILKQALIDDLKSEKCAAPLLSFIENANNNTED